MTAENEQIPFHLEMNKIIDLLAKQIYQSPLALLRENCQNAFDAVLIRTHKCGEYIPKIEVNIKEFEIQIQDNGIGMTNEDLKNHFWKAGSSGKNNSEARAAGVVGTFGIGAMANFGVAKELEVVTESAITGERHVSRAIRETLSAVNNCIDIIPEETTGEPGTLVLTKIEPGTPINISEAEQYISEFAKHLKIDVIVNEKVVSKKPIFNDIPKPDHGWVYEEKSINVGKSISCDIEISAANTGELWVYLNNLQLSGKSLKGEILLRQGMHQIKGLRSYFTLASCAVSSTYSFGGIANLEILEPTAGREALTTESVQTIQQIVTDIENFVSHKFSESKLINMNTNFMQWCNNNGKIDLCGKLELRVEPENRKLSLEDIKSQTVLKPMNYFDGTEPSMIEQFANEESPLIVISNRRPRKNCELNYLQQFCKVKQISNSPTIRSKKTTQETTLDESSLIFRIVSILKTDYFVEADVGIGTITHELPLLVDVNKSPVEIVLDTNSSSIKTILQIYKTDYEIFGSLCKDFVRTAIFPKVSNLVPSSTRQGAQAFLKALRRPKDIFEYEESDQTALTNIWALRRFDF